MFKVFIFSTSLFLVLSFNNKVFGTTCTALATGNWSNTANWSCGAVPVGGDTIVIPAAMTVAFDMGNYTMPGVPAVLLQVYGTLQFNGGTKLGLPANSNINIYSGGAINGAGGGGNSNYIKIGGISVWSAGDGNQTGPETINTSCPASSGGCTLPVTLLKFTGEYNVSENSVKLSWLVNKAINFSHFEVEKSVDAVFFSFVYSIQGINTNSIAGFNYADSNVLASKTYYYRLKEVDLNGSYTYSNIIIVTTKSNQSLGLTLSPNPAISSEDFKIEITNITNSVILKIIDLNGQEIFYKVISSTDPVTISS
ncbi:MAG TPA: hypothetical protein VK766_12125, partial [Cytophagaceae bacterium]|nr:hypothetical protein [Cytophagaceae bacterium]